MDLLVLSQPQCGNWPKGECFLHGKLTVGWMIELLIPRVDDWVDDCPHEITNPPSWILPLMDFYGFLWVCYGFLWIFMGIFMGVLELDFIWGLVIMMDNDKIWGQSYLITNDFFWTFYISKNCFKTTHEVPINSSSVKLSFYTSKMVFTCFNVQPCCLSELVISNDQQMRHFSFCSLTDTKSLLQNTSHPDTDWKTENCLFSRSLELIYDSFLTVRDSKPLDFGDITPIMMIPMHIFLTGTGARKITTKRRSSGAGGIPIDGLVGLIKSHPNPIVDGQIVNSHDVLPCIYI